MITLYGKTGCQYTAKAIAALDAHGLSFTKKNIANPQVAEELVSTGGKRQVPYLVDGDTKMYESDAIVSYLDTTYGSNGSPIIHIHTASEHNNMCHSQ